jgi:predicted regulator of Ras-like GTPase activity (Roadblock/LC7/MglB family)
VVASNPVDPEQALADLTEISSQIRVAALIDSEGGVAGSTLADEARASEFARAAQDLLAAADSVRSSGETLTQLEVATGEGSVFVLRDGGMTIAATTSPEPTVGLVFYDLKSCLRSAAEGASAGERAEPELETEEPAAAEPEAEKAAEPTEAETEVESEAVADSAASGAEAGQPAESTAREDE